MEDFCCGNGALTWSPLKACRGGLIPSLIPTHHLTVQDFMILPLLSQPPQKPVLINMYLSKWHPYSYLRLMNLEQQLHIFGHLIWTELSVKSYSSHPNRWIVRGGGIFVTTTDRSTKKIFARGKIKRKKFMHAINPKKYSCYGLKKIHTRNLVTKKISAARKCPTPPPPITFLMVRP